MGDRNTLQDQRPSGVDNMGYVDDDNLQVYKLPSKRAQILIQKERYKSQNYFDFNCVSDWEIDERPAQSNTTYNHTLPKGRRRGARGSGEGSPISYPDHDVSGTPNRIHAEQNTRAAQARSWNVSQVDLVKKEAQPETGSGTRSQSLPYTGTLTGSGTLRSVNIPLDQSQFHQVGTFKRSEGHKAELSSTDLPETCKEPSVQKGVKVTIVDHRPEKVTVEKKERGLERSLAKFVRQISRQQSYGLEDPPPPTKEGTDKVEPPKTYFDLALFTCACCLSPLGCLAVVFSVLSRNAHSEGMYKRSIQYSTAALGLSISGILLTIAGVVIILLIFAYPVIDLGSYFYWDNQPTTEMTLVSSQPSVTMSMS